MCTARFLFRSVVLCFVGFATSAQAQMFVPAADAFVVSGSPASSNPRTLLKTQTPGMISYVRFDLSSLPARSGGTARFALHVNAVKTPGPVGLHVVLGAWQENSVTWNTRPPIAAAPLDTQPLTYGMTGGWVEFDISAAVDQWLMNPAANFGIAIVGASSPRAYVFFDQRESGLAPTLTVTIPLNEVTVGAVGKTYKDPATAASNALAGDHWCVSPSLPNQPCTMLVDEGTYVLDETLALAPELRIVGAGIGRTTFLARKGLPIAVVSSAVSLEGLSIVNNQDGGATAVGLSLGTSTQFEEAAMAISKLAVRASGAELNSAVTVGRGSATFSGLDLAAEGGQQAVAVNFENASSFWLRVFDSTISASNAVSSIGIRRGGASTGYVRVENTTVLAKGSQSAYGSLGGDEYSGGPEFTGGAIVAHADGTAIGINAGAWGNNVTVTGTRIEAVAGTYGAGIAHTSPDGATRLEHVRILASHYGVDGGRPDGAPYEAVVNHSEISAGAAAIRTRSDVTRASIFGSVLKGEKWLIMDMDEGSSVSVANSVLDGLVDYGGSTRTCTQVYDRNYALLPSACPIL